MPAAISDRQNVLKGWGEGVFHGKRKGVLSQVSDEFDAKKKRKAHILLRSSGTYFESARRHRFSAVCYIDFVIFHGFEVGDRDKKACLL